MELVAFQFPKGAHGFELHGPVIDNFLLYYDARGEVRNKRLDFNGKLIGLLSDLTEQQAAEYVDGDYSTVCFNSDKDCLLHILTVNGLTTSAPILLIEKVK